MITVLQNIDGDKLGVQLRCGRGHAGPARGYCVEVISDAWRILCREFLLRFVP